MVPLYDIFILLGLWFQDDEFLQRKDKAVRAIINVQVSGCRSVLSLVHGNTGNEVLPLSRKCTSLRGSTGGRRRLRSCWMRSRGSTPLC